MATKILLSLETVSDMHAASLLTEFFTLNPKQGLQVIAESAFSFGQNNGRPIIKDKLEIRKTNANFREAEVRFAL